MNERRDPNVTSDYLPSQAPQDATTGANLGENSTKAFAPNPASGTSADLPTITGYRVQREIARGGMGRVLAAIDTTLNRDVAIKVLLPAAPPDRFIRESQITARLPHPGIPPVYSLGTLPDGSPYLAMKLIDGRTLISEINTGDRQQLLQIFLQICQAVGFAHSRGIIHRDLKPANVMVGAFGEVQVMDWGLAKDLKATAANAPPDLATSRAQSETSGDPSSSPSGFEQTEMGVVMGTPSYMSPEQARGEPLDARVDVFALGGILFSILTKSPPFMGNTSAEVLKKAASADLLETFQKLDRCDADPDLLAICRKCLSPNPTDRPLDGQAVAAAISGYLSNLQTRLRDAEISTAQAKERETATKRTRKIQLIAASLIFTALATGLGISLWQYREATIALGRALFAESEEKKRSGELAKSREQERQRADDLAKSQAQEKQRGDELSKVAKYQADMIKQVNPEEAGIRLMKDLLAKHRAAIDRSDLTEDEKTAKKTAFEKDLYAINATDAAVELIDSVILEPAVRAIDAQFTDQPLVDARIRETVAATYSSLGRPNKAQPLMQRSYELVSKVNGASDVDVLNTRLQLAETQREIRNLAEAEFHLRAVLSEYKQRFGDDHDKTLTANQHLASLLENQGKYPECESIAQDILARRMRANPDDRTKIRQAKNDVGYYLTLNGKYDAALKVLSEELDSQRREGTPWAPTLSRLAVLLMRMKQFEKAEPLLRELFEINRSKNGYDHLDTASAMQSLAMALLELRKFSEAESMALLALEKARQMYGNEHLHTLICVNVVGQVMLRQNKVQEAEPYFVEAYRTGCRALGDDHPEAIVFTNNLGTFYQRVRRFKEAEALYRASLERNRAKLGDNHPHTLTMTQYLTDFLRQNGNNAEAEKYLRLAITGLKTNSGGKLDEKILSLIGTLGAVCRDQGKFEEAGECFQQVIDWYRGQAGPDHPSTMLAQLRMASLKVAQSKHTEALEILTPLDGKISKAFPPPAGDLRQASLSGLMAKCQTALAKDDADFKLAEAKLLETRGVFNTLRGEKDKETIDWTTALVDFYTKWNEASPNAGHDKSAETWKAKLTP